MEYHYEDFVGLIQKSIVEHWDLNALTDYKGVTLQYKDVARKIEKLHILFETAGIVPGDKIAICGRNSAHWAVAFLATLTYGAIVVPILHEFKAEQVHNIVNHSDARLLFAGDMVWPTLDAEAMPQLEGIVHIPDFMLLISRNEALTEARERLNEYYGKRHPKYFRREHVNYRPAPDGEALAMINYTSGTTSNSKGVLIPYRALWSNYQFAIEVLGAKVPAGSRIISMLPMAHMYGMAFEFIFEFIQGIHVHYLTRLPSPKVIIEAFREVQPAVVISVPPHHREDHQEKRDAQARNSLDEATFARPDDQRQDFAQGARSNSIGVRRQILRGHYRRSGAQQGSGAILAQNQLQLHRGLRCHRMCPHHRLRRLEPFRSGFVWKKWLPAWNCASTAPIRNTS